MRIWPFWIAAVIWAAMVWPLGAAGQQGAEWIVPIVVNGVQSGVHYQTTFVFTQLSTTTTAVGVRGFPDQPGDEATLFCRPTINIGVPPADPGTNVFAELPGAGQLRFTSSGESPGFFSGWARVSSDRAAETELRSELTVLEGSPQPCLAPDGETLPRIDVSRRNSERVLSSVQMPVVFPMRGFVVETAVTDARETAIAIVNPTSSPAEVELQMLDPEGLPFRVIPFSAGSAPEYCPARLTIPPESRLVGFAWDLYGSRPLNISLGCSVDLVEKPEDFLGATRIVSDTPVAVGALHVLLPEGKFVNAGVRAVMAQ